MGLSMANNPDDDTYSEEEAERRREATFKVMLATPHKNYGDELR